jgi:hypothetical protein
VATKKSPFIGLTLKEVEKAERNGFLIQIGRDFYNKDNDFVFSLSQAEKYYDTLLNNILITMEEGNPKQRAAAEKCLLNLHIVPLRIQ